MATITGSGGGNNLNGTNSADTVYAYGGNDRVYAAAGADLVYGGTGNDSLYGDAGDDTLLGEAGADRLYGGDGNDNLQGGDGNDSLEGGAGNDTLNGGAGTDTLIGGEGVDTADYSDSTAAVTVNLASGTASGSSIGTDTLGGIENVTGSAYDDNLTGNGGDNLIDAGAGNDTVSAGAGSDTVLGGTGNDSIDAGVSSQAANTSLDFNWSLAGADESNVAGGVTQDTGGIEVSVSFTNDGAATEFSIESSSSIYVAPGESFNPTSSLYLYGQNGNQNSTTMIDFASVAGSGFEDEVESVSFRLADVDRVNGSWEDIITIRAYDADGNEVPVTLTAAGSDVVNGNTVTAVEGNNSSTDAQGSVLVNIPGPVARIVIDYDNGFTNGQLIQISDIHFQAVSTDDDLVDAGDGDDTVTSGIGNDTIYGGSGADSVDAGAGEDSIEGGTGADTLSGGDGNDHIDGGDDADLIYGGLGDDTILFGSGDDTVYGGDGNDQIDDIAGQQFAGTNLIYGGAGDDTVWSGFGNDTLYGGDGADVLSGEGGDDSLLGDAGADTLYGGDGNDVLDGGDGPDFLDGGADQDTIYGGIGDTVTGGGAGVDEDVLDLTAWGKARTNIIFDQNNRENGTVEFLDENGAVIGSMTFTDIETVVPCFTPGTRILTPFGAVPIEELCEGDLVLTRDNGMQPLRWIGQRRLSLAELVVRESLRPVRILENALGPGMPNRPMMVSPQHRMLIEGAAPQMLFAESEVLVAATHLCGRRGIDPILPNGVTYIHLMFDQHEIVNADGCWTESFQPGGAVLKGMRNAQRDEVLELFPELARDPRAYPAARPTLRAYEARVLLAA